METPLPRARRWRRAACEEIPCNGGCVRPGEGSVHVHEDAGFVTAAEPAWTKRPQNKKQVCLERLQAREGRSTVLVGNRRSALLDFDTFDHETSKILWSMMRNDFDKNSEAAWFTSAGCKCNYTFGSKGKEKTFIAQEMDDIPFMAFLRDLIIARTGEDPKYLNSAYMRIYKDGKNGVGWHRDDEDLYAKGNQSIYSFTLGAERTFEVKQHGDKDVAWSGLLGEGRLVAMVGHFQNDYLHRVPKEALTGKRINITFRHVVHHTCRCQPARVVSNIAWYTSVRGRMSDERIQQSIAGCSQDIQAESDARVLSALTGTEKEVLKLAKRLREIVALEAMSRDGMKLQRNQEEKLAGKDRMSADFLALVAMLQPWSDVRAKVNDVLSGIEVDDRNAQEPTSCQPPEEMCTDFAAELPMNDRDDFSGRTSDIAGRQSIASQRLRNLQKSVAKKLLRVRGGSLTRKELELWIRASDVVLERKQRDEFDEDDFVHMILRVASRMLEVK